MASRNGSGLDGQPEAAVQRLTSIISRKVNDDTNADIAAALGFKSKQDVSYICGALRLLGFQIPRTGNFFEALTPAQKALLSKRLREAHAEVAAMSPGGSISSQRHIR